MATNFTKVPNEKKVKIKVATNFTKVPNECTLVHCNFRMLNQRGTHKETHRSSRVRDGKPQACVFFQGVCLFYKLSLTKPSLVSGAGKRLLTL